MRTSIVRAVVVAMSVVGLSATSHSMIATAEAGTLHGGGGGGWHGGGGGGGWHDGGGGGGWHGGGWHGGGGGGWHGGGAFGGYNGWGYPGWGYGWDSGPGYDYPDQGSCWVYRDVWSSKGRYLGRRLVDVCE